MTQPVAQRFPTPSIDSLPHDIRSRLLAVGGIIVDGGIGAKHACVRDGGAAIGPVLLLSVIGLPSRIPCHRNCRVSLMGVQSSALKRPLLAPSMLFETELRNYGDSGLTVSPP